MHYYSKALCKGNEEIIHLKKDQSFITSKQMLKASEIKVITKTHVVSVFDILQLKQRELIPTESNHINEGFII